MYSILLEVFDLVGQGGVSSNDMKVADGSNGSSSVANIKSVAKQSKKEFDIFCIEAGDSMSGGASCHGHRHYIALNDCNSSYSRSRHEGKIVNYKIDLTEKPVPLRSKFVLQCIIEYLKCLGVQADKPRMFCLHGSSCG